MDARAQAVMERCEILRTCSDEPDRLTRRYGSDAMRRAAAAVAGWMRDAGLTVRHDSIGNLVGRCGAGRTLMLGSHLDTVRDAGKYDGPLGVLAAIAAAERLHARNEPLPFALEVVAFADEEGLRFHTTYLGSRVVAGTFDPACLELRDADGVSVAEAIRAFGGDPDRLQSERRRPEDLIGYCEVHIEQGTMLEARGLPVGVVSSISGQTRIEGEFRGEAGHAGTLPMNARRDALCGAAEMVLAAESLARGAAGLVATAGRIAVEPGASNVVPGAARLSLDVRHPDDSHRRAALRLLRERAEAIAARRELALDWRVLLDCNAVACAPELSASLARAIEELGYEAYHLASGAGHDAVALAELTPVAMLFVRCKRGVSHNPAEEVSVADVAVAIQTLDRFLELAARQD